MVGKRDKNESTYIPFTSESGRRRGLTDASVKGIHGEPGIAETERYEGEDGDEHPATTSIGGGGNNTPTTATTSAGHFVQRCHGVYMGYG